MTWHQTHRVIRLTAFFTRWQTCFSAYQEHCRPHMQTKPVPSPMKSCESDCTPKEIVWSSISCLTLKKNNRRGLSYVLCCRSPACKLHKEKKSRCVLPVSYTDHSEQYTASSICFGTSTASASLICHYFCSTTRNAELVTWQLVCWVTTRTGPNVSKLMGIW